VNGIGSVDVVDLHGRAERNVVQGLVPSGRRHGEECCAASDALQQPSQQRLPQRKTAVGGLRNHLEVECPMPDGSAAPSNEHRLVENDEQNTTREQSRLNLRPGVHEGDQREDGEEDGKANEPVNEQRPETTRECREKRNCEIRFGHAAGGMTNRSGEDKGLGSAMPRLPELSFQRAPDVRTDDLLRHGTRGRAGFHVAAVIERRAP